MNSSSIQLEFEQLFAKVALLLNGSYFIGIVWNPGSSNNARIFFSFIHLESKQRFCIWFKFILVQIVPGGD